MALIACKWLLQFIVPLTKYLQRVDLEFTSSTCAGQCPDPVGHFAMSARASPRISCSNRRYLLKHDVAVCKPRLTGRQFFLENVPSDSVSEYYKRAMYYPFLDHLISELDSRIIQPSTLFTITNRLPKTVGKWSSAEISIKEIWVCMIPIFDYCRRKNASGRNCVGIKCTILQTSLLKHLEFFTADHKNSQIYRRHSWHF